MILWLYLFDKSFSFLNKSKNKKFFKRRLSLQNFFLAGFFITLFTMSMSISMAILLPIYLARRFVNRKMVVAYAIGANISTLFDTLFLGLLTKSVLGISTILAFLVGVTLVAGLLFLLFKPYQKSISYLTGKILKDKRTFIIFTCIIIFVPIIFLFF